MIGKYLAQISPLAEHDVLTSHMMPGAYLHPATGTRCLVGCVEDYSTMDGQNSQWIAAERCGPTTYVGDYRTIEGQYDMLCGRFGHERVNAAIRNRILANVARRTLRTVQEPVPA